MTWSLYDSEGSIHSMDCLTRWNKMSVHPAFQLYIMEAQKKEQLVITERGPGKDLLWRRYLSWALKNLIHLKKKKNFLAENIELQSVINEKVLQYHMKV